MHVQYIARFRGYGDDTPTPEQVQQQQNQAVQQNDANVNALAHAGGEILAIAGGGVVVGAIVGHHYGHTIIGGLVGLLGGYLIGSMVGGASLVNYAATQPQTPAATGWY